jgi:hypothetical protein
LEILLDNVAQCENQRTEKGELDPHPQVASRKEKVNRKAVPVGTAPAPSASREETFDVKNCARAVCSAPSARA